MGQVRNGSLMDLELPGSNVYNYAWDLRPLPRWNQLDPNPTQVKVCYHDLLHIYFYHTIHNNANLIFSSYI